MKSERGNLQLAMTYFCLHFVLQNGAHACLHTVMPKSIAFGVLSSRRTFDAKFSSVVPEWWTSNLQGAGVVWGVGSRGGVLHSGWRI